MIGEPAPHLWLLVGPNGTGKSTYYRRRVRPIFDAPFVNADLIARDRWPDDPEAHAWEALREADAVRAALLDAGRSFVTETVFSHPSRVDLIRRARAAGYTIWMTFIHLGSSDLAVARVEQRVRAGGHAVPEERIRGRYERMPAKVLEALSLVDRLFVVDNSEEGRAFRTVLAFDRGLLTYRAADLPAVVATIFRDVAGRDRNTLQEV